MRLREPEMPLDPEVERELWAIDAGLADLTVDADLADLATLAGETRGLRSGPRATFAASLDERAAEGFPREGRIAAARAWMFSIPPRRVLMPLAAGATLLVAVGVGISQLGGNSGGGGASPQAVPSPAPTAPGGTAPGAQGKAAPAGQASARSDRLRFGTEHATPSIVPGPPVPAPGGGLVPNRTNRVVESNAQLTLGAASSDVQDVADGVVDVTHRYNGIVVSSQVTHGDTGARASFDLAIPSALLSQALADLSDLAHVQSSSEGSIDITASFVAAEKRLAKATAHLASLRHRMAAAIASGDTSREAVLRRRISVAKVEVAQAHSAVRDLRRRAGLARVSVNVTSDGAGAGSSWTFGDALHDAGRVLTVTAGVLLIIAAVGGPLAVLAILAWLAGRAIRRSQRERSLDAADARAGD